MSKFVTRFLKDESGATAIEYGLIAALMAAALVAGIGLITGGLNSAFTSIKGNLSNPSGGAAAG
jgi:pilus assembly protein Flp/PilA